MTQARDPFWTWTTLIHHYHADLWHAQNKLHEYRRNMQEANHQIPKLEGEIKRIMDDITRCVEGLVVDYAKKRPPPGEGGGQV